MNFIVSRYVYIFVGIVCLFITFLNLSYFTEKIPFTIRCSKIASGCSLVKPYGGSTSASKLGLEKLGKKQKEALKSAK